MVTPCKVAAGGVRAPSETGANRNGRSFEEVSMRGMRRMLAAGGLVGAAILGGACAGGRSSASEPSQLGWAELKNAKGESVGSAVLLQDGERVRIVVQARGLPPGRHAIHVHAVGRCEPPAFESAGAHFNPLGKKHGLENPEGAHGGDLADLEADASGRTEYVAVTNRLTLGNGPTSIFDADGSAVVIHAREDDQTDPSGNSGERLLCGQLVAGPTVGLSPRP
jgi:Cu-Zn family superoxide dismutase